MSNHLSSFLDHLEDDLTWRKTELSKLFILYVDKEDILLAKSLVLFLYSHWEGYIKNATKQYLHFISENKINTIELTKNFEAILLKNVISVAKDSSSGLTLTNEIGIINKIDTVRKDKFKIPQKILDEKNKVFINTHDNLTLNNFNKVLKIIGLPKFSIISGHEKYLDETLINQRNTIVHGTKINHKNPKFKLKKDDIKILREFIFCIIEYVRDELTYYSQNELYLIKNSEKLKIRQDYRNNELKESMGKILTPENYRKKASSDNF
jgi:hypothetical protein